MSEASDKSRLLEGKINQAYSLAEQLLAALDNRPGAIYRRYGPEIIAELRRSVYLSGAVSEAIRLSAKNEGYGLNERQVARISEAVFASIFGPSPEAAVESSGKPSDLGVRRRQVNEMKIEAILERYVSEEDAYRLTQQILRSIFGQQKSASNSHGLRQAAETNRQSVENEHLAPSGSGLISTGFASSNF